VGVDVNKMRVSGCVKRWASFVVNKNVGVCGGLQMYVVVKKIYSLL